MPEKYKGTTVVIRLSGEKAGDFLARKNVLGKTSKDEDGSFLVGKFSGRKRRAVLGTTDVDFGFVKDTGNREVVLNGGWLGNKGKGRRISVTDEGIGRQQFRNGVEIIVTTDAPITVFENNLR